jgi:hypothetical protein
MDIQLTIEDFINECNIMINYPKFDDFINELSIFPTNLGELVSILKLENNKKYYGKCKLNDINTYTYWKISIINKIENIDNIHLDMFIENQDKLNILKKYFSIKNIDEWEFYELN